MTSSHTIVSNNIAARVGERQFHGFGHRCEPHVKRVFLKQVPPNTEICAKAMSPGKTGCLPDSSGVRSAPHNK